MSNEYDPDFVAEKVWTVVGMKTVIENVDREILFLRRSDKCVGAGQWDFPGGGLDKGEVLADGARREIEEESGLQVSALRVVDAVSFMDGKDFVVVIGYSAKTCQKKVTLSWEHDEYVWLPKKKALEMKLSEVKRGFLEKHFEFGFGAD